MSDPYQHSNKDFNCEKHKGKENPAKTIANSAKLDETMANKRLKLNYTLGLIKW
jgi:hypothetical protein